MIFHFDTDGLYGNALRAAVASIPSDETAISLRTNNLGARGQKDLNQLFAFLPKAAIIDLGDNRLGHTAIDLSIAVKQLHQDVHVLVLDNNDLGVLSTPRLKSLFACLSNQVSCLNLAKNKLGNKSANELADIFSTIHPDLIELDLSFNDLDQLSIEEIRKIVQPFCKLKKLNLRGNKLEERSAQEQMSLIVNLPSSLELLYQIDNASSCVGRDSFFSSSAQCVVGHVNDNCSKIFAK